MNEDLISIIRDLADVWNDHDVEGVLDFFADDATVSLPGIPPRPIIVSGKQEIRRWLSDLFLQNSYMEVRNVREIGEAVLWNASLHLDRLAILGLDQIPIENEATFENGKIRSFVSRMSEEGMEIVAEVLKGQSTS